MDPRYTARPRPREPPDQLCTRWRVDHDQGAPEQLVSRFLPLARRPAMRYARGSEPIQDLMQVAALGLLGAIDRV